VIGETIMRRLPVRLTEQERQECARECARLTSDAAEKEKELEALQDAYKKARGALVVGIFDLNVAARVASEAHATGAEYQQVECAETLTGETVTMERVDTGEVVSSRPATEADRQMTIAETAREEAHEAAGGRKSPRRVRS